MGSRKPRASPSRPLIRMLLMVGSWQHPSVELLNQPVPACGTSLGPGFIGARSIACKHPRGGERKPYGTTRSLGLKRGTIVKHPRYGLSTVGGFDRKSNTISLHAYRTNKRLTQKAKVKDCRVLTWVAFRSWLVANVQKKSKGKGLPLCPSPKKGRLASSPCLKAGGSASRV